jgi:hypothetical protein
LKKDLLDENICIWGKEIQIWMKKNSIRILEGLINFIEDLVANKINFLELILGLNLNKLKFGAEIRL